MRLKHPRSNPWLRTAAALARGLAVLMLAFVPAAWPAAASEPDDDWLLPDLQTLPPSDLEIRVRGRQRLLRLANTVWNSGEGTLELLGVLNLVTNKTMVTQRVYDSEGGYEDREVGEFIFHLGHDHWHFENFAKYELLALDEHGALDRVVASSAKVSYCLIETDAIDREHPDFNHRRRFTQCGRTQQGLQVGWGDKYDAWLDGQSLDITGLPNGVYALRSTANPSRWLYESDYENNTAILYIEILDTRVAPALPPTVTLLERCLLNRGRC